MLSILIYIYMLTRFQVESIQHNRASKQEEKSTEKGYWFPGKFF